MMVPDKPNVYYLCPKVKVIENYWITTTEMFCSRHCDKMFASSRNACSRIISIETDVNLFSIFYISSNDSVECIDMSSFTSSQLLLLHSYIKGD